MVDLSIYSQFIICFVILLNCADSVPRWSWGRFAQAEILRSDNCKKGHCVQKSKCPQFLILSEKCGDRNDDEYICCANSTTKPSTTSRNSSLFHLIYLKNENSTFLENDSSELSTAINYNLITQSKQLIKDENSVHYNFTSSEVSTNTPIKYSESSTQIPTMNFNKYSNYHKDQEFETITSDYVSSNETNAKYIPDSFFGYLLSNNFHNESKEEKLLSSKESFLPSNYSKNNNSFSEKERGISNSVVLLGNEYYDKSRNNSKNRSEKIVTEHKNAEYFWNKPLTTNSWIKSTKSWHSSTKVQNPPSYSLSDIHHVSNKHSAIFRNKKTTYSWINPSKEPTLKKTTSIRNIGSTKNYWSHANESNFNNSTKSSFDSNKTTISYQRKPTQSSWNKNVVTINATISNSTQKTKATKQFGSTTKAWNGVSNTVKPVPNLTRKTSKSTFINTTKAWNSVGTTVKPVSNLTRKTSKSTFMYTTKAWNSVSTTVKPVPNSTRKTTNAYFESTTKAWNSVSTTVKPIPNSTRKTTKAYFGSTTKAWNSVSTTVKPVPNSTRKTTKSTLSKSSAKTSPQLWENKTFQSTKNALASNRRSQPPTKSFTKPTKSFWHREQTSSSMSNFMPASRAQFSSTTNSIRTSQNSRNIPTSRTTRSSHSTSRLDSSTSIKKQIVTKSPYGWKDENSDIYSTNTPLPDINNRYCGIRNTNTVTVPRATSDHRIKENDRESIVLFPDSRKTDINSRRSFQRIVGGKEAEPFTWPWVAALYKVTSSGGNRFLCAGSLINENFVLTAAHVFTPEDLRTSTFVVLLGTHTGKEARAEYAVMDVLQHPLYEPRYYYHDIALLRLEQPVTFDDYVMPVCLPSPSVPLFRDDDLVGKKVTVMGWGDDAFGGVTSRVLKEATFPIVSRRECNASYIQVVSNRFPKGITRDMLCAGSPKGGKDACQGDSGGPLTTIENGRYTQVGIVSFGYKCGDKDYPGVYTKISSYLSWIAQNARCDNNDYF